MVNIKRPAILQNLLRYLDPASETERAGFSNGVVSGLIMRQDTTPGAPFIRDFYTAGVEVTSTTVTDLWPELVQHPAEEAVGDFLPALRESGRLGEIFRYQDLAALAHPA